MGAHNDVQDTVDELRAKVAEIADRCLDFERSNNRLRARLAEIAEANFALLSINRQLRADNARLQASLEIYDTCIVCGGAFDLPTMPSHCDDCVVHDDHLHEHDEKTFALEAIKDTTAVGCTTSVVGVQLNKPTTHRQWETAQCGKFTYEIQDDDAERVRIFPEPGLWYEFRREVLDNWIDALTAAREVVRPRPKLDGGDS